MKHISVAEVPEDQLVRSLLRTPGWRERFIGLHGIPDNASVHTSVLLTDLGFHGDIDVLIADPSRPDAATAIQVKRVKVQASTFRTNSPNKLSAIAELKRQTNLLVEIGFAQVICYVVVVVDSRYRNAGEYRFEGLTRELSDAIADAVNVNDLAETAGLVHLEVVQPIDDVPLGAGTGFTRAIRMPTAVAQDERVTTWVMRILSSHERE